MIGKWMLGLAAAALWSATGEIAQAATSVLTASGAVLAQGGVTIKQSGVSNYVLEGIVVAAMFGAALFIICKSSRRV
jgi:hypothetical protein